MRLTERNTFDPRLAESILAVPIGSCEQHGPHLPLGTDTIIAEALAERLATALDQILVAPAITMSASGEHQGFAGTLSIGRPATTAAVVELGRSADWAAGVVLVNGHGGNVEAVGAAVETLRHEGRRVAAWWPVVPGGDAHAGRTETSLMLAIRPDLVDRDRIEVGTSTPLVELAATLRRDGVRAASENGVLGDPRAATLGHGIHLLDLLTADLVATTRAARDGWATAPS